MDNISTNPIHPITPFNSIKTLSPPYQLCVQKVLDKLLGTTNRPYDKGTWNQFIVESLVHAKTYHFQILEIAEKIFPNNHKSNDAQLKTRILNFKKEIQEAIKTFDDWNAILHPHAEQFKITKPHFQLTIDLLKKVGQQYGEFDFNSFGSLKEEQETLIKAIKSRIQEYVNHDISVGSLTLIVNVHDIHLSYLTTNFENYKTRTEDFKSLLIELQNEIQTLNQSHTKFKETFKFLTTSSESQAPLKSYLLSKVLLASPTPTPPLKELDVEKITEDQDRMICFLFQTIIDKTKILSTVHEECSFPYDPLLSPLLMHVQAWTPCHNKIKMEQDNQLLNDVKQLIKMIDEIENFFDNQAKKYQINLSFFSEAPMDPIRITDSRVRGKEEYANKNGDLKKIAEQEKDYREKINKRIKDDLKSSISNLAVKKICQTHDITESKLRTQIEEFHTNTVELSKISKKLSIAITALTTSINNFVYAYDYFCYLDTTNEQHTSSNANYFYLWRNSYRYINKNEHFNKIPWYYSDSDEHESLVDTEGKRISYDSLDFTDYQQTPIEFNNPENTPFMGSKGRPIPCKTKAEEPIFQNSASLDFSGYAKSPQLINTPDSESN